MWHYAKTYKTDKNIFEAGEEYLLEKVTTYAGEMLTRKGEIFSDDMLSTVIGIIITVRAVQRFINKPLP